MPGKHWTETELNILARWYPYKGARETARMLERSGYDRSPEAIRLKASALFLTRGVPKGHVPLSWVHPRVRKLGSHSSVSDVARRAAEEDGVLVKVGEGYGARYSVPEEWADKYMARLERRMEAERLGWLTTAEAAAVFGLSTKHLRCARLRPESVGCSARLRAVLAGVRVRRGYQRLWFWHPGDVREAARALREKRAA